MTNNKVLICYEGNWADEIDIKAAILTTLKEWNQICEESKLAFAKYKTCTHHMGNQEIDYTSYEEWFNCYTVIELTDIEYKVLNKFDRLLNEYRFFIPEYYEEDND